MKTPRWSHDQAVAEVANDIWRYISHAAHREPELHVEAAAILGMSPAEVRTLAQAHFILGDAVARLLDAMPRLMRRLATTTVDEEERSAERIRGPIRWGPTLTAQAGTGVRQLYVTAPARRAYETPENRVLIAALAAIVEVARRTGWHRLGDRDLAGVVRTRYDQARGWMARRAFAGLVPGVPSERTLRRVAAGRARRRYQPAVDVIRAHQRLVRRLDRRAVRSAVEEHALVTSDDDTLFELMCGFAIERELKDAGWAVSYPGLVRSRRQFLVATRAGARLECYYQGVPPELSYGSRYQLVQREHSFSKIGRLRPDFVIRFTDTGRQRWIVVEVKGGPKRRVAQSARDALSDLLAYRRDYQTALADNPGPYGLGIAWGLELDPVESSEALLCTPDRIGAALAELT
jgi:hypothetical protein